MAAGEMTDDEYFAFLLAAMKIARDSSRDGALAYWFIDWRHIAEVINAGRKIFSRLIAVPVWVKNNAGMGSIYRSQHEMIAVFKKGGAPHINNVQLGRLGRYRSTVWQYDGTSAFSKSCADDLASHPTIKPAALLADAIRDASRPGDLVLDLFGGSGTTMLAAHSAGRRAALVEIDPKYVDVTLQRFFRLTGIEPVLLPGSQPFSVVKAQRAAGS